MYLLEEIYLPEVNIEEGGVENLQKRYEERGYGECYVLVIESKQNVTQEGFTRSQKNYTG